MADEDGGRPRRKGLRQLARHAGEEMQEMLGRRVTGVLGMQREDDGWTVTIEVIEVERVPETTNLMGIYKVTLDEDGELVDYRRTRSYHRGQPDEDG